MKVFDVRQTNKSRVCGTVDDVHKSVSDKIKGKTELMKLSQKNKVAARVFTATVLVPQFKWNAKSFDLSVHKEGNNLELWMSYKGGGKTILVTTPPP